MPDIATPFPRYFMDALRVAAEFDTWHVGSEHVLVALLRRPGQCDVLLDDLDAAREGAVELVARAQRLNEKAHADPTGDGRPAEGSQSNPKFHEALGRARAFAAALGDGVPEVPTLLALWWDDTTGRRLYDSGVRSEALDELLRRVGYAPVRSHPAYEPQSP
jgi:hypothetical protein